MKIVIQGKVEIQENESGYCPSSVLIHEDYIYDIFDKHFDYDEKSDKKVFRITIEEIEND